MHTGVSFHVPGYKSSPKIMSVHICTGHRCLPVRHWIIVVFLTPFLCVMRVGDTLLDRYIQPLLCVSFRCVSVESDVAFLYDMCSFHFPLVGCQVLTWSHA